VRGSTAGIGYDWGEVIRLLAHHRIDPRPLFSQVIPLEDLEKAIHELKTDKDIIKIFVSPEVKERIYLNQ